MQVAMIEYTHCHCVGMLPLLSMVPLQGCEAILIEILQLKGSAAGLPGLPLVREIQGQGKVREF